MLPKSLAGRLALALALLQSAVVLAGMAAWMLTSPYVSWTDVATETAGALVAGSVTSGPDGNAVLQPTESLMAYASKRPTLRWAALHGETILDGSQPDLAAILTPLGPWLPNGGRLAVPLGGGEMAAFSSVDTPAGQTVIVTAGNRFHVRDDLGTFFSTYALQLVPMFGPAILAAVLLMPLAVRRILRPLRAAAREAEAIGLDSLDRRLAEPPSPTELHPFLAAINRLLGRIEEGVQRQRIFSANAAHELRTPVAILQARIDALPESLPDRAGLMRDIRRVTLLLDQLLAVARLGQREVSLDESLRLPEIARIVVSDMAPLAIRSGRYLALEQQGPAPEIRGNARALESAIGALIENALRAEPEGGTVIVEAGPGPRLAVIDHGQGVSPADSAFLFEPFWRKNETTPGTGLGLAIVQQVARLHGGRASVAATPGGGATFVLTFPVADVAAQGRVSPPAGWLAKAQRGL